jgi:hypothetical protein
VLEPDNGSENDFGQICQRGASIGDQQATLLSTPHSFLLCQVIKHNSNTQQGAKKLGVYEE